MSVEDITKLAVGDRIRFKTKAVHDNVYWSGTVTAICGYDVARQFGGQNLDIYYHDVKRIDGTLRPAENLTYFILKTTLADGTNTSEVFAVEWVDISTFEYVESTRYRDIRIYGIDNNKIKDVLGSIQELYPDYVAEILN
jgi:hypothetical protein